MGYGPGSKTFTVSGAVGSSDGSGVRFPVTIYDVCLVGGGTGTNVDFFNGATSVGAFQMRTYVLANSGDVTSTNGVKFKDGCYLLFRTPATSTTATVSYHEEPA